MTAPDRPGAYDGQLAERAAELLPGIGTDERLELLAAMDEDDMRTSLAWLAAAHPQVFDHALVRDRALAERLLERLDEADTDQDDPEPYCARCGADIGIFIGHGDGWHHWRRADGGRTEIYDAGHEPAVAWREAGAADDAEPEAHDGPGCGLPHPGTGLECTRHRGGLHVTCRPHLGSSAVTWPIEPEPDDGLPRVPLGGVADAGFDAAGGAW